MNRYSGIPVGRLEDWVSIWVYKFKSVPVIHIVGNSSLQEEWRSSTTKGMKNDYDYESTAFCHSIISLKVYEWINVWFSLVI